LHKKLQELSKNAQFPPAVLTDIEHQDILETMRSYTTEHGEILRHFKGMQYWPIESFVRILKALGSAVPNQVIRQLKELSITSVTEEKSRKRKRDDVVDQEQPIMVYEVPYHWPDHHVEYGNAMRVIKGVKQRDYPLPPVSPNIELFRLPKNHPAHGNGSSLGVRAVANIKEGEVLCHYAGVIEPFHANGLVNMYVMHDAVRKDVQHNALVFGNEARFINAHNGTGLQPNVAYGDFDKLGSTRGEDFVTSCQVVATRDIKVGEELLADYGEEYWKHPHFAETNKVENFEVLDMRAARHDMRQGPVVVELFGEKNAPRDPDYITCRFNYRNKSHTVDLSPSQYEQALFLQYPNFQRDQLVEVVRVLYGKIVKRLAFFKGFILDEATKSPRARLSQYSNSGHNFVAHPNRVTVPTCNNRVWPPQIGASVFVNTDNGWYEMATVVNVDKSRSEAQVQVLGEVDEKKLCPLIRTVKSTQIFEK